MKKFEVGMNIEKIKEIVNGDFPNKRNLIIWVLAEDEDIMTDLLSIANAQAQQDKEFTQAVNLRLSEIEAFLEYGCKPTPKSKRIGTNRESLLERIAKLRNTYKKISTKS